MADTLAGTKRKAPEEKEESTEAKRQRRLAKTRRFIRDWVGQLDDLLVKIEWGGKIKEEDEEYELYKKLAEFFEIYPEWKRAASELKVRGWHHFRHLACDKCTDRCEDGEHHGACEAEK